ncbi:MAG: hypothetical protein MJ075_03485 [Oscillospiraceae bacterium]|nr:hypothetical protein [Oscillospiraceae bacterium]
MSDTFDNNYEMDDFSLESILAEFKGDAYIDGARKTSDDILEAQIQRILAESKGDSTLASFTRSDSKAEEELADDLAIVGTESPEESNSSVSFFQAPEQKSDLSYNSEDFLSSNSLTDEVLTEAEPSILADVINVPAEVPETSTEDDENVDSPFFSLFRLGRKKQQEAVFEQEDSLSADEALPMEPAEEASQSQHELQESSPAPEPFSFGFFAIDDDETETEAGFDEKNIPNAVEAGMSNTHADDGSTEILFFDDYRYAESDEGREFETTWQETYEDTMSLESGTEETSGIGSLKVFKGLFSRLRPKQDEADAPEAISQEEEFIPEPEYEQRSQEFAKQRHSLMLRSRAALFFSLLLLVITLLFERGVYLPGIADNGFLMTAVSAVLLLVVMALSLDLLQRGFAQLLRLQPGAESLLLLSSLIVLLSCFTVLFKGDTSAPAPFCVVSSFALSLSLWGEYRLLAGMYLSLKTASASESPDVYTASYHKVIDASLIQHFQQATDGFYNNLTEADVAESTYHAMAPILILLALFLAFLGSIGSDCSFIRALAAIASASAAFSMLSAYAIPFSAVAKRLRRSGSALAGWGGADIIYYADGIRLCESDLFPAGAAISGVKIFDNREAQKIIRYTGSLLRASGSGISEAFSAFMDSQGISHMTIDSFEVCEGGYSAYIRDDNILIGTSACLNLYGIRIPEDLNMKNAMFASLNGELSGVFMIQYKPTRNVQNALLAMLHGHLKLFAAGRDFNISPLMIQQKLQIPADDIEPMPFKDAYEVSENLQEKRPSFTRHS